MSHKETPLFELKNVSVGISHQALLDNISFKLLPSQIIGISAPSGTGKTTLLKTIAGLISPLSGEILFEGKRINKFSPSYRRKVVFVAQQTIMLDTSVLDNIKRPFQYVVSNTQMNQEHLDELIEAFHLKKDLCAQNAKTLSQGEQQRIAIIRALIISPKILLLDEPTSSLDSDMVSAVENTLIDVIKKNNSAAIIVSHDKQQIKRLCGQEIILSQSKTKSLEDV